MKIRSILIAFLLLIGNQIQSSDRKIALLYPSTTISLPTENASWLIDIFYQWELFLIQNKYNYEIIDQSDLESDLSGDFSLLILPAVKTLSENEIAVIQDYMSEGNSVLATMSLGVFSKNGDWRGWNTLEQLFGLTFHSEIKHGESSQMHSLLGGLHITKNIPAGFRLQVTTYDKPIEVKINSENTYPIGYWLNEDVPFEGIADNELKTSAVYGNYGLGNFVWLGFEMSAIVGAKLHREISSQFFRNIIEYLRGDLITQIETWPNGNQSAAVFSCDVEDKFNYINYALDIIEEENVKGQFYILTNSVDEPSFERLLKFGDVGLHGDEHSLFKWQDYNTQLNRISSGLNYLKKNSGVLPLAFRPIETMYDNSTLEAMINSNLKILSSDFIEDRAIPQFLPTHPEVFIIPKTGFDDYDIFWKLKIGDLDGQSSRYLLDFYKTHKEGGLYTLNYHTQLQCNKEFAEALRKPIQYIKSQNVWITTHNKVYEWWMQRNSLKLKATRVEDNRFLLEVENSGESNVEGVVISFQKTHFKDFSTLTILHEGKNLDFNYDFSAKKIKLNLPTLVSKQTIRLDFRW